MQDRIRAIANALDLQTIIWKFDSNDWRVGTNNITTADVDADYQLFINNETAGNFNTAGAIMLTHELNNYTMQEAVNFYPALKAAFSVRDTYILPIARGTDIYASTWSPSASRSTRRTRTRRPTIHYRRSSSVRRSHA